MTLLVVGVAQRVPVVWGRFLGRALGRAALGLRRRERRRARRNLAIAFPERPAAERDRMLKLAAVRLGENLADALAAPRLLAGPVGVAEADPARRFSDEVRRLAREGRGVLVLTGHLGCWELLGAWIAQELAGAGLGPLAVVTGTVRNPAVDRLVQERRRTAGLVTLPRDGGPGPLVRHLAAGGVAAVLLDQNLGVPSLAVPFLGRPAPTARGFARMALARSIPVLPVAIGRDGAGHTVRLGTVLRPDGAGREAEEAFLAACNEALGELIRRNPAEWVWFHDRWNDERSDART